VIAEWARRNDTHESSREAVAGIVVISAEPKELTFVNIVGPLEVDQLAELGGEFGIPKLNRRSLPKAAPKGDQK